jgi:hypothetical protein
MAVNLLVSHRTRNFVNDRLLRFSRSALLHLLVHTSLLIQYRLSNHYSN